MTLQTALYDYIKADEDPEACYNLGIEYYKIGQTASATTFLMKAAERFTNNDDIYLALLLQGVCFTAQGNRNYTSYTLYRHAICVNPGRPEAYYLIAKMFESDRKYTDGYTWATMGLATVSGWKALRYDIGYRPYSLEFEKAVCSWHWGKGDEARAIFSELSEKYLGQLDEAHYNAINNNLHFLGSGTDDAAFIPYTQDLHSKLKYKFPGSDTIIRNHSQVYQDMFILAVTNGKRNGTFLEVGGYLPYRGNNTALLEEQFGWTGATIEIKKECCDEYAKARRTKVINQNALEVDYVKLLNEIAVDGVVDYLQLDCEPPRITFEILLSIPFDKFKFGVITFEHDYYLDMTKSYKEKSRKYLRAMGYELVVGNVAPSGVATFEDWWIHPDLIKTDVARVDKRIVPVREYMLIL